MTATWMKAALHEISCRECRVTWISWLQRLTGDERGMSPRPDAKAIRRSLPWRARFRLRWRRCVDGAAIWLVDHQHFSAARRLWRIKS